MKTIIVYGTKYGCTKKCAEILTGYLEGDIDIVRIKNEKIDLEKYDNVIIGGSVYMGKIQKEIMRFCKKYKGKLMNKKVGIFISCYTSNDEEGFMESLFSKELLEHACIVTTVGGEMDYDKMNFVYRKMFQSLKKIDGFNEEFKEPELRILDIKKVAKAINKRASK
ncbi:flavodoxin domain-containing protein [Miniphocaeibacter massiliensis]|uniref:flavodoxin domain-containing protein n=1 Tax=Miniphocaeibacter massiliensis TaxID=2041841 RepID=UPI000C1C0CEE|nr:flavodoxin domain-containing protein [Miniphocaeibacter massiliensis]